MSETKKYELTSETLRYKGCTLHRIKALKDFGSIKAGELGGWIESEENLSQANNAWVYGDSKVYEDAKVYDDAVICGNARVRGNARVFDNAMVYGLAKVGDKAEIGDKATICDKAEIRGNAKIRDAADYIVFKDFWSNRRYFTWTRSNNKWNVGGFHGTGEELIKKAYSDSEISGREYERVVRYVEGILADEKKQVTNHPAKDKN